MRKTLKIYLATNYSHPEAAIRQQRFEQINAIAAEIMDQGHIVYSPISHSHPIALAGNLPTDYPYWKRYADTFIGWCDELWWYAQVGWEHSRGLAAEREIAAALNKPIKEYTDLPGDERPGLGP